MTSLLYKEYKIIDNVMIQKVMMKDPDGNYYYIITKSAYKSYKTDNIFIKKPEDNTDCLSFFHSIFML